MSESLDVRFLNARDRYITAQFSQLNDMQRKAVLATEGPLLLLAGAGSGKTTVLINRIANLIRFGRGSDCSLIPSDIDEETIRFLEELPADCLPEEKRIADRICAVDPAVPWSILAITFTNKAAGEMKSRLSDAVGSAADDVWAMTFHAACCRILRRDIAVMGYTRDFTIYDSSDSERLMKTVLKELNMDEKTFPPRYVLGAISREKDQMHSPQDMQDLAKRSGDLRAEYIARAYVRYQTVLKENNALDFDDIIFVAVQLLQSNPEVLKYYQRKFRYVLVDEYQDTNHMQYLLASLLAGGYQNICVVGDDDQSIYRFRGATIDNILNFEKHFKGARTIRLEQNYRSTQSILNAANGVISHNVGRKGKKLWTANGTGDPVTVYEAFDEGAEANYVAGQILANARSRSMKDHAILYRTNAQSNALEYALKRNGIPYRIIGGMRFFERAEVKDILSYLCIINNPADTLRLLRIINNPPRGIGPKALETAQRLAQSEDKPLFDIVSHCDSFNPLEKNAGKFHSFSNMIHSLQRLLTEGMSLPEFYDEVLRQTGYEVMLLEKDTEENKTRLENIRELKSSIQNYMTNSETPTLAGFLEEIALYTDIEQYNESDDAVVMMTIHSAKGLEFPVVYLVGFEEGLFPGQRAIGDNEEMEEERRLCYVAITRAKQLLTITHARQRMIYGKTASALPSRFLREIPENSLYRKNSFRAADSTRNGFTDYRKADLPKPKYRSESSIGVSAQKPLEQYQPGNLVQHSAFGKGMVTQVTKLPGDALLEVAFDTVGTKRLMAKAASAFLKKLQV